MNKQYETLIKTIDDVLRIITKDVAKSAKEKQKFMPVIDRLLDHRSALSKQIQTNNEL